MLEKRIGDALTGRSYTDTDDFTPGTTYYYQMRGVNAIGFGPWSAMATVKIEP